MHTENPFFKAASVSKLWFQIASWDPSSFFFRSMVKVLWASRGIESLVSEELSRAFFPFPELLPETSTTTFYTL